MKRERNKPAEIRREELLKAAERLFLSRGVDHTSVDQIAAAAKVAKGTFYLYFQSKEQLLLGLQQRFIDSFSKELQAAMDGRRADDWKGRLRAWLEAAVGGYLDRTALHEVVFHQFRADAAYPRHENSTVEQLAQFLERGAKAGAWSMESPHLTAVMLFSGLHGVLDAALERTPKVNQKRLVQSLELFFYRAVGLT